MDFNGIKPTNALKNHIVFHTLAEQIGDKIKCIPSIQPLKGDLEVLKLRCNAVENSISSNPKKAVDKKALVIEILRRVFPITTDGEFALLASQIQMLFDNNLIKKDARLFSKIFFVYPKVGCRNSPMLIYTIIR